MDDRDRIKALERQVRLVSWMASVALGTLIAQAALPLINLIPGSAGSVERIAQSHPANPAQP